MTRRVLVVGAGGREHALADAAGRSPTVTEVWGAPGNAGFRADRVVDIAADDTASLLAFCRRAAIDLVIVGPEIALAAGLVDVLSAAGIAAFGPMRAAAELEWSKAAARAFCSRHRLPSPEYGVFADTAAAKAWFASFGRRIVVKASGLAAGKGVIVPADRAATLTAIDAMTGDFVLEELLEGEEVSLLAFSDGRHVVAMPPAQDHKRIGEGDTGPNTGGMGAYAPAPGCPPELVKQLIADVLQPTIDGLRTEGHPYVGVLYAGLMLTADGPKVLEFNCRFGDPEAQALLPLLDTDLLEVIDACLAGRLDETEVRWRDEASCAVVLASTGYPGSVTTGHPITGLDAARATGARVFYGATSRHDDRIVTSGGRVVTVVGMGVDVAEAREQAYGAAGAVAFDGRTMRRDIGWRALARSTGGYASAGVDIDAGNRAVALMKNAVERTHGPAVLRGLGAFGGVFDAAVLSELREPVLVASTDGVGTKVMVAAAAGRAGTVGTDIVNHCINDVLVQRARPLFFLDYIASGHLDPSMVASIVASMADACAAAGCALLGGETAEMPGVYREGHFDIAGTLVGVAEKSRLLPRTDIAPGDVLLALASNGPHTNGYSLLRRVFAGLPLDAVPPPLEEPLVDALLAPHRSYLKPLEAVLATDFVKALVHITGGGLPENLPRALPPGCGALVRLGSWPVPPLFRLVREVAGLDAYELHRTLNMGVGMVIVASANDAAAIAALIPEPSFFIGEITATPGVELR